MLYLVLNGRAKAELACSQVTIPAKEYTSAKIHTSFHYSVIMRGYIKNLSNAAENLPKNLLYIIKYLNNIIYALSKN